MLNGLLKAQKVRSVTCTFWSPISVFPTSNSLSLTHTHTHYRCALCDRGAGAPWPHCVAAETPLHRASCKTIWGTVQCALIHPHTRNGSHWLDLISHVNTLHSFIQSYVRMIDYSNTTLLYFSLTAQQAAAAITDEKEEAVLGPVIFTAPNGKDTTVSTDG